MVEGLANQARVAQEAVRRDLETATAKLAPLSAHAMAEHQARRDVRLYLAAKAAYTEHQAWLEDEYFPFSELPERDRQHWMALVQQATNIVWRGR